MKNNIILSVLLFIIALSGCKKEAEIIPRNYPFIITLTPENTNDGVHLSAKILDFGSDTILSHGFVWWTDEFGPTIKNKIVLTDEIKKDTFNYDVVGGLIKGSTYHVRAFVITKNYQVYGIESSFICTGTKAPEITGFSPKHGNIGTKVIINGKYFAPSISGNLVQFGDTYAKVDSATTNMLMVTLNNNTLQEKVKISVETAKMKATSADYFSVIYPWLQKSSFDGVHTNATSFSIGDYGYVINPKDNQMLSYNSKNDNWQKNINLPEYSGKHPLSIAAGNRAYVLLGTGFWEYNTSNNSWERKADFPGVVLKYVFGFSIDVDIYIGNCYENYKFWKYNSSQNSWERKADFVKSPELTNKTWGYYSFASHNRGFLGINSDNGFRKLWQYNPVEDSWVNKAALLTYAYGEFCCFVINDEAYVGLGRNPSWVDSAYSNRIWKYDYSNNLWIEYHGCNEHLSSFSSFSINQKGYTINNSSVWEFNPANN